MLQDCIPYSAARDRIELETILADGAVRDGAAPSCVRIWSGQRLAWWRPDRCGYTGKVEEAGLYEFEEAMRVTGGLGPERMIAFDLAYRI